MEASLPACSTLHNSSSVTIKSTSVLKNPLSGSGCHKMCKIQRTNLEDLHFVISKFIAKQS